MTLEEKKAMIEKNLERDPDLKAQYQALAEELGSSEEAAKNLGSNPDLSTRYAAIMAKITNGMELDEEELSGVSGGILFSPGMFRSLFGWLFGETQPLTVEPAPAAKSRVQASTLGYDPSKGVSVSHTVYDPAAPVEVSPLGTAGEKIKMV